jgi:hypothetical protein
MTRTTDPTTARVSPRRSDARRVATSLLAPLLAALVLAACTSTGSATPSAAAQVKLTWTRFFAGSTPASKKIELLQDGNALAPYVRQAFANGFAKSITVHVSKVTVHGTTATVTYDIRIGGVPELTGLTGQAVKAAGSWKVSTVVVCGLLGFLHLTPPACAAAASGG